MINALVSFLGSLVAIVSFIFCLAGLWSAFYPEKPVLWIPLIAFAVGSISSDLYELIHKIFKGE